MKEKRFFILFITFVLFGWSLCAQTYQTLSPSATKTLSNERNTSITIKCSISNCEVYINNSYQGRTDLEITSLSEGTYNLEVRKDGYEPGLYKVKVKRGYGYTYSIKLRKLYGYIELKNLSTGSEVYVDGERKSGTRFEADVGTHEVSIRRFGYREAYHKVTVKSHETVFVDANLKPIDFSLESFSISRDTINPDYSGILNKCEISFYVTANGSAEVFVEDFNGEKIWSHKYTSFKTWENTIVWDGKNSEGQLVPDGLYSVGIIADKTDYAIALIVTRDIFLPLISVTPSGGGIGSLPMAYHTDSSFIQASLAYDFNLRFNSSFSGNYFDAIEYSPVRASLLWGIGKWAEIGGSIDYYTLGDYSAIPFDGNIFAKTNFGIDFNSVYWTFSLLGRAGISTIPRLQPYGVDTGNGLGLGFVTGVDSDKFYLGLSSEFIWGPENGNVMLGDKVFKNGFAFAIKPKKSINIDGWVATHTAFGVYVNDDYANKDIYAFRGVESGLELKLLPGLNHFLINTGLKGLYIINSDLYVTGSIGLSYLF